MSATEWERPVDRFKRSAAGSVVAAGLLGLRDALEGRPEREEVVIVGEAPTAPPPDGIDVVLDLEHPERSVVYVWDPADGDGSDA
ncbi:MAG TPA: hypothetical protein VH986_04605 [Acidimicrobiia bacterium]